MRPHPSAIDRTRAGRPWRRHGAAAPTLALVLLGALAPPASPQAPGPESFAAEPKSPIELWDAADYLVRTGQAAQAVPYLRKFLEGNPDDATLLQIRDRYGVGSILRLTEFPETRALGRSLLDRLSAASRRGATQPGRIQEAIAGLTASRAEQDLAVERLREAGPYAVPAVVAALNDAGRSREDRALIAANAGRLGRETVPAWIAVLDAPEPILAADAASILGRIGDTRALPALTYHAARRDAVGAGRDASRQAVARLTGRPFEAQPRTPARVLTDEARRYLVHAVPFPGDSVEDWEWAGDRPAPRSVSRGEAEGILGLRYAREALDLAPTDPAAQAAFVALALEKAVERSGLAQFPAVDPTGAWPAALAAGPAVLGDVLRQAIADGQTGLAAAAAAALGQVIDRDSMAAGSRPSPLVEAVTAPDRRVQFAAARALVELDPARPFPGSDRVVPALARFVAENPAPRAVVIDGNVNRGNRVANLLRELGYDATAVGSGEEGFRQAAATADVEAVFVEPSGLQGSWRVVDTLANLRADARTAGLPIFLLQPDDPNFERSHVEGRYATAVAEREPNDIPAMANPLRFPPDTHRVRITGLLPTSDARGDYYRIGPLRPGTTVVASLALPSSSSLTPTDALLTLDRELLLSRPGDTRSFPVAAARAGRLTYRVPVTPEPEPKDPAAEAEKKVTRKGAKAAPPEEAPTGYGGYLLHVRPPAPTGREGASASERGFFPQYVVEVAVLDPDAPVPGPTAVRERLEHLASGLPRVAVVVPSTDPALWRRQVEGALARMGARPLSAAERAAYARAAAALLAQVAGRPNSPFAPDLAQAGPALTAALSSPTAGLPASAALAEVPGVGAQRGLADAALDPGRPIDVRRQAAESLARSLQRFGPLLASDQEARLVEAPNRESDPALRAALASAVGALRPKPADVGRRLPAYRLAPAAQP